MSNLLSINIGDILTRAKCGGCVQHAGVAIGHDTVLSNTPETGEYITTLHEFAADEHVTIRPSYADPAQVIARARKILAYPKKYNPVLRNCQHTVTETVHGVAKSPAVLFAGSVLIGVFSVLAARVRR